MITRSELIDELLADNSSALFDFADDNGRNVFYKDAYAGIILGESKFLAKAARHLREAAEKYIEKRLEEEGDYVEENSRGY